MSTAIVSKPETIDRLTKGVYPAFAMLAGMQLDLFTPLKDGPMSVEQLAGALGAGTAKLKPLLYALVTADLLTVQEELFANTPEADRFLVQGSPAYIGERHTNLARQWSAILNTAESVRAGTAKSKLDFSTISPDDAESSSRSRHQETIGAGRDLVARYDFSRHSRLLDVGGRSGGLTFAVLEAHPHIRGTVVDLPATTPITERYAAESGLGDRVQVITADIVDAPPETSPEGLFDAVVLRHLIQVLDPGRALAALKNVIKVMEPGGTIYVIGSILDDSRISPPHAVASSLNFLNIYDGGQAFTEGEYRQWLDEAGFQGIERVVLPNGSSIITAGKPVRGTPPG